MASEIADRILGTWDYVIIVLTLAVSAAIGVYFRFTGGRQKTTREFLMAGKDMSILPVAFSLMATYMSAISVLGMPSETYMYGAQFLMWLLGLPIGVALAAYVYLPVFFEMDATTAYEYLERRFGKTTRTIVSCLFTIQMILYMAVVLYAPSVALNAVTGLSTWSSVVTLAVVCTFYCSLGGLKAVLWTDVFQSVLMYVAIISIVVKGSMDVGGLSRSIDIAYSGGRMDMFNFTGSLNVRYTFWNSFISGILFSLSTFGSNQTQIQRLLSVRSLKRAQWALWASVPLIVIFNIFCFWDGIAIYSLFHDCDPLLRLTNSTITKADQLLPYSILKMYGDYPGFCGLCIAGVFSASLSTISSAVNSLTAVTMEDFIRPFCLCKKLSESWLAFLAKIIAIGYGGLCLLLTFIVANFRGVIEASNILFGMVGGPVLGVFTLGILTSTSNETGLLIGLVTGFLFNAWMGFGSYASGVKVPHLVRSIEGCPENLNMSLPHNGTFISIVDNSEVFPLYQISFLWFPIFGCVTVIVVGYISSLVIAIFSEQKELNPNLVSPALRKFLFKTDSKEMELSHVSNGKPIKVHEVLKEKLYY